MEVKNTPIITIVLNELYTEFFKQVFKLDLLNTKQGHTDKGFGLCFSKCSLPSKALFLFLFLFNFKKASRYCHSFASLIIMGDEFLSLKIMYMY